MDNYIGQTLGGRYEVREVIGTGGMATKIRAAEIAGEKGIDTVIARGDDPAVLYDIVDGKPRGTRFIGRKQYDDR